MWEEVVRNNHVTLVLIKEALKGYSRKKYLGEKKANNIFFFGWLMWTFFKLYRSLVFEKNLITWAVGFYQKVGF